MSRMYGEPVEVQVRADGRPIRFVWRSRLYLVRAVAGHWVLDKEWWTESQPAAAQPEQEFWRVEAAAGQGFPAGTYELLRDVGSGTWTLRSVVD